jgi:hypothetical protein
MRSTNVYEECSLGIFVDENDDIKNEADYPTTYSRVAIWGHCLGRHTRRQLSFGTPNFVLPRWCKSVKTRLYCLTDMWWLALALFIICIAEVRKAIENRERITG